jgi:hypothetical protein
VVKKKLMDTAKDFGCDVNCLIISGSLADPVHSFDLLIFKSAHLFKLLNLGSVSS